MFLDWLAFLLLIALYLAWAAPRFVAALRRFAGSKHHGGLLAALLIIPYLLLTLPEAAVNQAVFLDGLGRMALYLAVPTLATLYRPPKGKPLHLLDILAILAIWFPIEFGWLPDVDAHLAAGVNLPVATLTAVDMAFLLFLVIRPLSHVGYTFRLTRSDCGHINTGLAAYTLVGIPIGLAARFLIFAVVPFDWFDWALAWPLGYLFTALPEELLFRGVIQNQIHGRIKNEWVALAVASIIFGLAHLNNSTSGYPEPNWMYAVMATLAGLAYGWTWRKTGKITASAVVHATVNFVWGILLGG